MTRIKKPRIGETGLPLVSITKLLHIYNKIEVNVFVTNIFIHLNTFWFIFYKLQDSFL
nr:MAG TPA: hypothetical protein [Caudoviricetes sp.]